MGRAFRISVYLSGSHFFYQLYVFTQSALYASDCLQCGHVRTDHGYDGEPEEAFVKEIDDMRTRSDGSKIGVRDTINDWIDGGSLEVYYCDQIAYLKKLGYKNVEKWPEDKIYSTYKHLLWRDGYHLYYEIKNGEKDPTKTGLYFAGEGKPRTRESNKRKVRP